MRKPRVIVKNARYHVVARANRGEFIFAEARVKEMFLAILRRARQKYSFLLENFCIMNNHVHLLIRPGPDVSLSKLMQWILSVFAQTFNREFGHKGHVWYDRFRSKVVRNLRQFAATFRYIAKNPQKAGLVADETAYEFSGVHALLRGRYSVVDPPGELVALLFPQYATIALPG